ncbi:unnamed protein product [Chrysoparadoxa australica]
MSLAYALGGSIGSITGMTLLYPLDQARTLVQIDDALAQDTRGAGIFLLATIARKYGKAQLFRGCAPVILTVGFSNFIYLLVYRALRALAIDLLPGREIGVRKNTLISALAGVVNVFSTAPLWVTTMRIRSSQEPKSFPTTMRQIAQEEGALGLFAGVAPSLALVTNPIIQFVCFEWLKRAVLKRTGRLHGALVDSIQLRPHEAFLVGMAAKCAATLLTYPLQLAQSRMRAKACVETEGTFGCIMQTVETLNEAWVARGLAGLYQGLEAKILHSMLLSGFQFLTAESFYQAILRMWRFPNREKTQ